MEEQAARPTPMCMRKHHFLLPSDELETGHWRCDGRACAGEVHDYNLDGDHARDSVDRALAYAASRFSIASVPDVTVWSSPGAEEPPEATHDRGQHLAIYLTSRGPEQTRYQAGHEAFHVLFTPIGTRHWLHETLAVSFALEFLAVEGLDSYRQLVLDEHDRSRAVVSLTQFVATDTGPYPPGLYERASRFGRTLARVAGSEALFEARESWNEATGRPDYWAWVDRLPNGVRSRVTAQSPERALTR